MIASLEWYHLETELFCLEIFLYSKDDLQSDLAEGLCLLSGYNRMEVCW